jgi:hypothetical protein
VEMAAYGRFLSRPEPAVGRFAIRASTPAVSCTRALLRRLFHPQDLA